MSDTNYSAAYSLTFNDDTVKDGTIYDTCGDPFDAKILWDISKKEPNLENVKEVRIVINKEPATITGFVPGNIIKGDDLHRILKRLRENTI